MRARFIALVLALASALGCSKHDDEDSRGDVARRAARRKAAAQNESSPAAPAAAPSGVLLTSADGRFSVTLPPGTPMPSEQSTTVPTAFADMTMHAWEGFLGDSEYAVMYADYAPEIVKIKGIDKVLVDVQSGVLSGIHSRALLREAKTTVAGLPAREFEFEKDDPHGYGTQVVMLQGNRLYQLCVLAPLPGGNMDARAKAFIASFAVSSPP